MKVEFSARTREAENLRTGLEKVQATLEKAEALLGQLGGEKDRWSETAKHLEQQLDKLPKLKACCESVAAQPAIKAYIAKQAETSKIYKKYGPV